MTMGAEILRSLRGEWGLNQEGRGEKNGIENRKRSEWSGKVMLKVVVKVKEADCNQKVPFLRTGMG